jgi:hypothetical protein
MVIKSATDAHFLPNAFAFFTRLLRRCPSPSNTHEHLFFLPILRPAIYKISMADSKSPAPSPLKLKIDAVLGIVVPFVAVVIVAIIVLLTNQ